MRTLGIYLFVVASVSVVATANFARADLCQQLLAGASLNAATSSSNDVYLKLLKVLAENKNAFTVEDLTRLASQAEIVNPLALIETRLSPAEKFSFSRAFESAVQNKSAIDLAAVKAFLLEIIRKKVEGAHQKEKAMSDTEEVYSPIVKVEVPSKVPVGHVINHMKLDDGRLLVFSSAVFGEMDANVIDPKTKGVTSTRIDGKEVRVVKTRSGERFMVAWSNQGFLSLHRLWDDNKVFQLGQRLDYSQGGFALAGAGENSLGHPFAVLSETRETSYAGGPKFNQIVNFYEVDLTTGDPRHFPISVRAAVHAFVSGDGHVMELKLRGETLALRDLSADGPVREISRRFELGYDPASVYAPRPSRFMSRFLTGRPAN